MRALAHPSQEDEAIVEIAKEVAAKLGVSRFDLKNVLWVGRGQSDECNFLGRNLNLLVLPKTLKGTLRPEEWSPLIASAIIRSKSGSKLVRRAALTRLLLPSAIVGTVLSAFAITFAREQWTPFVLEAGGLGSVVVLGFLYAPKAKKVTLTIDRLAAEAVGRSMFLQVLQKIDGMGLKDIERLKAGGLRRRFKPSISERIENLQT